MATINFVKRTEKGCIYVRVKKSRKVDLSVSTHLNLPMHDWDTKNGFPKKNIKDASRKKSTDDLRKTLERLRDNIEEQLSTALPEAIDRKWLENIVNPSFESIENAEITLLTNYITDHYITDPNKDLTLSSKGHAITVKGLLCRFSAETGFVLNISDLNGRFIQEFKYWMDIKNYSLGYKSRTLKAIKGYCRHADSNNGIKISNDIRNIIVRFEKVPFVILGEDELTKIYETPMPSASLENAKLWLLISCYTGQRVSDFLKLSQTNLHFDERIDGYVLELIQVKTGAHIKLPILEVLKEILEDIDFKFPRKISEQKYNEYIKEVCKVAGIGFGR